MNLGAQYYRPPFPETRFWEDDMRKMKDSGLNTVQLWLVWAWIESRPGTFAYDDYDRLTELANKNGLGLVLSTIAEMHPYWIFREVPGCELVDHLGRTVVSGNRCEIHYGVTPGGCFDHPGVWERMATFLKKTVEHFRTLPNLRGWDAWNEIRWNVHSEGLTCYCEHTIKKYHEWLDRRFNGLDGVNRAWKRRYGAWDEVFPGRGPERPFTDAMAFSHFITERTNTHARMRYDLMKSIDPAHTITVHGAHPCVLETGDRLVQPLHKGNDWHFAKILDGVGCSSFPKWGKMDDADFGMRIEFVKSAAAGKKVWLSELQGGRSQWGFDIHDPVDAVSQQRWVWNGIACGADTILFWCWRDEVFTVESAGFGIIGLDGHAHERLEAMKITGKIIREHADVINNYRPAPGRVGILFSPQSYYLRWACDGKAVLNRDAVLGYARALVRASIPYTIVEEEHLEALNGLDILFLPRVMVTDERTEKALVAFAEKGGTLVCESECGAFSPAGLYRYPEDRFLARLTGISEIGRRTIDLKPMFVVVGKKKFALTGAQWLTPMTEKGLLLTRTSVGKGAIVMLGSFFGDAYYKDRHADFEKFIEWLVSDAGVAPQVRVKRPVRTRDSFVYVKHGAANGKKCLFVFFPKKCSSAVLHMDEGFFKAKALQELVSGTPVHVNLKKGCQAITVRPSKLGLAVLFEHPAAKTF